MPPQIDPIEFAELKKKLTLANQKILEMEGKSEYFYSKFYKDPKFLRLFKLFLLLEFLFAIVGVVCSQLINFICQNLTCQVLYGSFSMSHNIGFLLLGSFVTIVLCVFGLNDFKTGFFGWFLGLKIIILSPYILLNIFRSASNSVIHWNARAGFMSFGTIKIILDLFLIITFLSFFMKSK